MRVATALILLLAGCGRYEDFRLPAPKGELREAVWSWDPHPEPVIRRGPPGSFDSVDALNPSWDPLSGFSYSGWDGKVWRTGTARTSDGMRFEKSPAILIEPLAGTWEGSYIAANGASHGSIFFYQAGAPIPKIGRLDAGRQERAAAPVLEPGPRGAWDERGVGDPYIVHSDGKLYLYFLGQDRARRQRLGLAYSVDQGRTWVKYRKNPILELGEPGSFDETGLGEPAVWDQFGKWWMLYTGRDRREWRRTGLAVSTDGVHWSRVPNQPVMDVGPDGSWYSRVVCDPHVQPQPDGTVRVYFGGGDKPEPAENLNGQIGVGTLRPNRP